MKKLVLSGLAALLLVGCSANKSASAPQFTKQDFVGEWVCLMDYEALDMKVVDHIELSQSGDISDQEFIMYPMDRPIFRYLRTSVGQWALNGNELTYTFSAQKVSKEHLPKLQEDLNNKKKVAKDKGLQVLKKVDDELYRIFSNESYKTSSIKLEISKFKKKDRFFIKQVLGERTYHGACFSKEIVEKINEELMRVEKGLKALE